MSISDFSFEARIGVPLVHKQIFCEAKNLANVQFAAWEWALAKHGKPVFNFWLLGKNQKPPLIKKSMGVIEESFNIWYSVKILEI